MLHLLYRGNIVLTTSYIEDSKEIFYDKEKNRPDVLGLYDSI